MLHGSISLGRSLSLTALDRAAETSAAIRTSLIQTNPRDSEGERNEGDVIRNAGVLKQQLVAAISVQDSRLKALQQQQKQIENNLQLLGPAETSAAMDFLNQMTTAKLLLEIEIGDSGFRLNILKEFLERNF